jgi:hypothetical protein
VTLPPETRRANRLADETSPYLLQHAHNPVDWYPWGPAALERARELDRPILLSIGYAACHWCHVMERESFENDEIAELMNRLFVPVKVDREERPDLDEIYMAATVAMTGSGGWPMTVFLTPEQTPFYAGTYFPPTDGYGRPGFSTVLRRIAELWQSDRQALLEQGEQLLEHVRAQSKLGRPAPVGAQTIARAANELSLSFDERWGGFGRAPKFPPCSALLLLLRHHRRSGDEHALEMVRTTLDAMKNGGIYDHIGGGFARYSTDERWLVPHFEKMLYDNAQLAVTYLEAYQVTSDAEYRRVSRETLDYVLREMQGRDGGFYSATDADSEGEEGKFFVWQSSELYELLGGTVAERFCRYYGVTDAGNWEGKNVLHTPHSAGDVALQLGISVGELEKSLQTARDKVSAARAGRIPPLLDDKVLASWNGLMVAAMAEGYRVLGESRYLEGAERAARYVSEQMVRPDGGLYRTARSGRAHIPAYLEDYAYLCDALITLYEAGGSYRWLARAVELAERLIADFGDPSAGFFHTAHRHEELPVRVREGHDGALPSPNAVAARALGRLSFHLDRPEWRKLAELAIFAYGRPMERSPRAFCTALQVVDLLLEGPVELALVGARSNSGYQALERELAKHYLPNRIQAHHDPVTPDESLPLLRDKALVNGRAALYVCQNFTCQAPVTEPKDVAAALTRKIESGARDLLGSRYSGSATPFGTRQYADQFQATHGTQAYAELGSTHLVVSRLGFGGYRVSDENSSARDALEKALRSGVNLIDTSTNYTDGKSERLIGEVLSELFERGKLSREQVVVVSKIGYIQGSNYALVSEREKRGKPLTEVVKYGDGIWHCIHPEWIEEELGRSLGRLRLETLDFCLLHNPEYFLSDAVERRHQVLEAAREQFYARLAAAFEQLEKEVKRGRILHYGVSSNTSVSPAQEADSTSLGRMLAQAERAGGKSHHFRMLELPLNLLEAGAVQNRNTGPDNSQTVLDCAIASEIAVLANRPLNAFFGDSLSRLVDPPAVTPGPPFAEQLEKVRELETEFRKHLATELRRVSPNLSTEKMFDWGTQLLPLPATLQSFEQYRELEAAIVDRVAALVHALDEGLDGELGARWSEWRGRYLPELEQLLVSMGRPASERSHRRAQAIERALETHLPGELKDLPLAQKAMWAVRSVPGVSSVLVGMRQSSYVEEALRVLNLPAAESHGALFSAAQAALPA